MGGGLMQLVAYGAQDVYLTGNPQITFFKVVYRRHTNFSVEAIEQTFNGSADFGRTVTATISRNGDLLSNTYLNVTLPAETATTWGYVRRVGYAMIESAKLEIGGSKIDEVYGSWMNIWNELSRNNSNDRAHDKMVGNTTELTSAAAKSKTDLYVPLPFFFCRNVGLALPLIALQYHDVKVTLKFRDASACMNVVGGATPTAPHFADAKLLCDFVYLDSEERKRFAQAQHEYLFEQLQFTGAESVPASTNKYRLNFNHPCKELIWAFTLDKHVSGREYVTWAMDGDWEAARNRFAAIVWLAAHQDANGDVALANAADDQLTYTMVANGNTLATLAGKVTAIVAGSLTGVTVDQVQVLTNNCTLADMSTAVADLTNGAAAGAAATLNANKVAARDYCNHGSEVDGSGNPCTSVNLQLNGHDRFATRDGNYFNYVQPYQHHSNTPSDGVCVYSFALKPEEHQPSGSCNMSRIDNATLSLTVGGGSSTYFTNYVGGANSNTTVNVYATNYNVLRIMSGMGGVAYSN